MFFRLRLTYVRFILEVGSRRQNEACSNRWTWNKIDSKFGFFIKFYARIQSFRLLGPTKLFLWPFKNHQIFQELYGLSI